MSLSNNTFKSKRYFRTKFTEGKYLLASEASDLQLESQELIKDFIKSSYGNFALDVAFKPEQTSSTQITIRPGFAWQEGVPFILKSGTDAKVILGNIPSGVTLTELSATTVDVGGKRLVLSGLANGSYSVVIEVVEELVKASGTGAVDTYLQGVNVGETTAFKSRLIYKIHVVLTSALSSTPTYPLADPNHYVNQITVTPTGIANFLVSSTDITQDLNGADRRIIINNSAGNIPFGTFAQDYINGIFVDSDGNEMVITSITTTDAGATVQMLLDREVNYNAAIPKAGLPIITNNVPYTIKKADHYATSTTGEPLGRSYWRLADFTFTAGSLVSLSDRRAITAINSFEKDLNIRLVGGGNVTWSTGTNNLSFSANLKVTLPSISGAAVIQSSGSPINIPSDGQVVYIIVNRSAASDYNVSPVVAAKSAVPTNANVVIIAERHSGRVYFPHNGSFGSGTSSFLGGTSGAIPPVGSIIPFYDFNNLVSFDSSIWAYCDGTVLSDGASPLNGQTLPDLTNRYLVGFVTDWRVASINHPGGVQGTGYTVGDIVTIVSGNNNATVLVNTVNGSGGIITGGGYTLLTAGTGYTATGTFNVSGGTGIGAQIIISTLDDSGTIGVAPFSATPVGAVDHEINLNHSHTLSNHTHTVAHSHSLTPGTAWAQITLNGPLVSNRISIPSYTYNTTTANIGSASSGSTTFASGIDGDTDSATPTTSGPSTANTSTALSATQSIQPRSVRVRFLIRKV